jgi:hypothetical protein
MSAVSTGCKPAPKHQIRHAICVEIPTYDEGVFSAADLAGHVAAAFEKLRDEPPRTESGWRSGWSFPIVPDPVFAPDWSDPTPMPKAALGEIADDGDGSEPSCGSDGEGSSRDPNGFRFGYAKGGEKPRRSTHNVDKEYRSRASHRETCRHDPSAFGKLITDDRIVGGIVLNKDELASEALDIVSRREDSPGLEVFRRGVIAWGKAAEPFPYTELYFRPLAERLSAEGYQPPRARTPSRMPGAVVGAHAACAEHGIALDELETVIADGSKPIIRRHGVVLALRKGELPKRPKYPPPPAKPASGPVRHLTLVASNTATITAVKLDGGELLAA